MKSAPAISETTVRQVRPGRSEHEFSDALAVEEPLEIRLGFRDGRKATHRAVSITMRTPGDDESLAAGFLFTEGVISGPEQIRKIRRCGIPAPGKDPQNTVVVELAEGVEIDLKHLERHFYTTSSCGVCGKTSIEALRTGVRKLPVNGPSVSGDVIHGLPETLRRSQGLFERTGGLHASALFGTDGRLDSVREDVGRHNALDKVIGSKLLNGELPLSNSVLVVSGRASFELVQKALMAGISILAAVGAPSSLAVELAREYGMTLVGFVRQDRFNVYCGGERIRPRK